MINSKNNTRIFLGWNQQKIKLEYSAWAKKQHSYIFKNKVHMCRVL